jgi:hypothetical protein
MKNLSLKDAHQLAEWSDEQQPPEDKGDVYLDNASAARGCCVMVATRGFLWIVILTLCWLAFGGWRVVWGWL